MRRAKHVRLRRRLVRHHLPIAFGASVSVAILYAIGPGASTVERLSLATSYVAMALLALTLAIGPWRVLRGRRPVLSSDLRRDAGIWTAVIAVAHVVLGLQVHVGGHMVHFFFEVPAGALPRSSPPLDELTLRV